MTSCLENKCVGVQCTTGKVGLGGHLKFSVSISDVQNKQAQFLELLPLSEKDAGLRPGLGVFMCSVFSPCTCGFSPTD